MTIIVIVIDTILWPRGIPNIVIVGTSCSIVFLIRLSSPFRKPTSGSDALSYLTIDSTVVPAHSVPELRDIDTRNQVST